MSNALPSLFGWWNGRSPRERVLLAIMLALIALTALWYGAVQPLQRGVAASAAARAESAAGLAEAEAIADRIEAQRQKFGTRRTATELEELILTSAAQGGVLLERHQADGSAVTVWAGAADSKRFFTWLALLHSRHGVGVSNLTAIPGEGETIQAQATLAGPA